MTTHSMERRTLASDFATRAAGDNKVVVEGYAYKFRRLSQNLGGFREQIIEGAGAEALGTDDIRALVNHDPNLILARNTAGTLRLSEDSTGLLYEIDADLRQSYARDLMVALERGDVTQSSFVFRVTQDGESWSLDDDEFPLRSITKMSLFDVSPVTYPAYTDTEVKVSSRALSMAVDLTAPQAEILQSRSIALALPVDPAVALYALRHGKR